MSEEKSKSSGLDTLKTLLTLVTIISAIAFLGKIFNKLFGKDEQEENEVIANKSRQKEYTGTPPSYPDFVYKDFADTLDTAILRQANEDENSVYSVFDQMKNISDVNKTIEMFGHRRQMFSTYYISLPQAVTSYFSAGEKRKLNGILKKKKIAYTFN